MEDTSTPNHLLGSGEEQAPIPKKWRSDSSSGLKYGSRCDDSPDRMREVEKGAHILSDNDERIVREERSVLNQAHAAFSSLLDEVNYVNDSSVITSESQKREMVD